MLRKSLTTNKPPLKIAITGPESTGKSTLAEQLARHYHTVFVPEYARLYIGSLDRPYNQQDLLHIAQIQQLWELKMEEIANNILLCDTELFVVKIWNEVVFGSCPSEIEDALSASKYDLYLLMNIDLPWENDPLREHPHRREELFNRYTHALQTAHIPFITISGSYHTRLKSAISAIDVLLAQERL